jgi:enediyne biosynthesis protein E5
MSNPLLKPSAEPPKKSTWSWFESRILKPLNPYLAPMLITCILAVGAWKFKILEMYPTPDWLSDLTFELLGNYSPTFVAIIVSILAELVLGRVVTGKWPHLASSYVSGISVGIIVRGPDLVPYILCALIAIASKYAIRVGGRHIWNPSNFSISVLLFLGVVTPLSFQVSNTIYPILVIWCFGSLILWRLRRLHITATYVATFLVLSYLRSLVTHDPFLTELGPLTGAVYQLFIFFMITDPKSTTLTKQRQCVVAVLVAVVETLFRLGGDSGVQNYLSGVFGPGFTRCYDFLGEIAVHAPYYALFVVGPITNLIEIWYLHRQKRLQSAPALLTPAPIPPIGLQSGQRAIRCEDQFSPEPGSKKGP